MTTWNEFNQGIITGKSPAWDIFNKEFALKSFKKEARSQEEIEPVLFTRLREQEISGAEIRKELAPDNRISFLKELGRITKPELIKDAKFLTSKAGSFLNQMVKNIRGTSQVLATPIAGALALPKGGVTPKEAMKESLKMAKDVMFKENVPFDQGVQEAGQMWLKNRGIGKYGGKEPNALDVSALAMLGFFNLFGDPAFEFGIGLRSAKILKEFATFKKVGQVKAGVSKGTKIKPFVLKISDDLKIVANPKKNTVVFKGYKKRFFNQSVLPDDQLAKQTTDLVMNTREATGFEMIAKFQGDDLILKPKFDQPIGQPIVKPAEIEVKPITKIEAPVIEEPKIKSKLGIGVEAKAIEKKLLTEIGDLPEFSRVDLGQQAKLATDLILKDPDLALQVAKGLENPPKGLLPESIFTAVEEQALKLGDVDIITQLARSNLVTEATVMGQRIRALGERSPNSPVEAIKDIIRLREKKLKGISTKETVKEIKKNIKVPKREDWEGFIKSIEC